MLSCVTGEIGRASVVGKLPIKIGQRIWRRRSCDDGGEGRREVCIARTYIARKVPQQLQPRPAPGLGSNCGHLCNGSSINVGARGGHGYSHDKKANAVSADAQACRLNSATTVGTFNPFPLSLSLPLSFPLSLSLSRSPTFPASFFRKPRPRRAFRRTRAHNRGGGQISVTLRSISWLSPE